MKIPAGTFYSSITGRTPNTSHPVMKAAFERWGVPYTYGVQLVPGKAPRMYTDTDYEAVAKAVYALEQAALAERKAKAAPKPKKMKELTDVAMGDRPSLYEQVMDLHRKMDKVLEIWGDK